MIRTEDVHRTDQKGDGENIFLLISAAWEVFPKSNISRSTVFVNLSVWSKEGFVVVAHAATKKIAKQQRQAKRYINLASNMTCRL